MTPQEMHALEKAALEDPFLADALEGYAAHAEMIPADTAALNARLRERLNEKEEHRLAPVVPLRRRGWWAAAAVLLIAVSAAVAYQMIWGSGEQSIARTEDSVKKNREAPLITPVDSSENTRLPDPAPGAKENPPVAITSEEKDVPAASETSGKPSSAIKQEMDDIAAVQQDMARSEAGKEQSRLLRQKKVPAFTIQGEVKDMLQKPVSGVVVTLEKEKSSALTDSMGRFSFLSKDSSAIATVNVLGFVPQKVELKKDALANKITLENSSAALDEVVVVGYGMQKKQSVTGSVSKTVTTELLEAVPVNGWPAYKQYLEDSVTKSSGDGALRIVIVSFEVRPSGKLTRFRIEQSAGKEYDNEALRLIKTGPLWKTTTGKKAKGRVSVTFR